MCRAHIFFRSDLTICTICETLLIYNNFWLLTAYYMVSGYYGPQTSLAKAVYTTYLTNFLDSPMEFHCSLKTFSQYFCRQMAKILLAGLFPSAF